MNGRFDLHILTQPHSEVYCGYFRRLVFGEFLTYRLVFMLNLPISHVCLSPVGIGLLHVKRRTRHKWRPIVTKFST